MRRDGFMCGALSGKVDRGSVGNTNVVWSGISSAFARVVSCSMPAKRPVIARWRIVCMSLVNRCRHVDNRRSLFRRVAVDASRESCARLCKKRQTNPYKHLLVCLFSTSRVATFSSACEMSWHRLWLGKITVSSCRLTRKLAGKWEQLLM